MNQIQAITSENTVTIDSREVALMVGKEHSHLMRDIRTYCEYLGESNFGLSEFFIAHTYQSEQNKQLPCYLVTRKGCEMIANKMTGEKGVLFTAAYINKFHEMEQAQPNFAVSELSPELRLLINMEVQQKQQQKAIEDISQRLDDTRDIIALNPNSWRPDTRKLIVKVAQQLGGNEYIRDVQSEIFKLVDERAKVSLETRLTNKRRRMADEGVCKSKRNKLNKVDVIAEDPKLIEIYIAVVKEYAIKVGVSVNEKGV